MEIIIKSLRACRYKEDLKVGNPDPKHDTKNDTEKKYRSNMYSTSKNL